MALGLVFRFRPGFTNSLSPADHREFAIVATLVGGTMVFSGILAFGWTDRRRSDRLARAVAVGMLAGAATFAIGYPLVRGAADHRNYGTSSSRTFRALVAIDKLTLPSDEARSLVARGPVDVCADNPCLWLSAFPVALAVRRTEVERLASLVPVDQPSAGTGGELPVNGRFCVKVVIEEAGDHRRIIQGEADPAPPREIVACPAGMSGIAYLALPKTPSESAVR